MLWLLLLVPGFSEIMPDPTGADNNLEYVEVMWNDSVDNVTFVLGDSSSNDTAELVSGSGNVSYLLFVEEGFDYSEINSSCAIFSIGATIGNNLGNSGDQLWLSWENETITAEYAVSGCAAGGDCSLSDNGSWVPTVQTPCAANVFPAFECAFNVSILVDRLFSVGETITYKPVIEPKVQNFTVTYWWEDLYGEIVRDAQETRNDNTKRFTPKQPTDERDWGLFVKVSVDACNESVSAEELVIVKGTKESISCPIAPTCGSSGSSSVVLTTPKQEQPILVSTSPEFVDTNEMFIVTATVYNEQFSEQKFNVSAYVYRGSKNYSPRESKEIVVNSFSQEGISFDLTPDLEPGEYFLKIKAVREGRKTPYEERRTIVFSAPPEPLVQKVEVEIELIEEVTEEVNEFLESDSLTPITGSVLAIPPKKSSKLWISGLLAGGLLLLARFSRQSTG